MMPLLGALLDGCQQHAKYLLAASGRLPTKLTAADISTRSDALVAALDQFAYRFVRLQDTLGGRVFRRLLIEHFGEPYEDSSLRDVVDRLEKLKVIESADRWGQLRAMRNSLAHDYPESVEEKAAAVELAREMANE
ncbi:MAG: hypothetical protein ACKVQK_02155, partial [Burkholderiales bacterium]